MSNTFSGGVYLDTNRDKICRKNLLVYDGAKSVKITLFCAGHEFEPAAAPGDHVRKGQVIGTNAELEGFAVRAPISGTVTNVSDIMAKNGCFAKCVEIENDFSQDAERLSVSLDKNIMTADDVISAVREAGIVENDEPLYEKLRRSLSSVDTLIVDAVDDEPWICSAYRTLCERAEDVVDGIRMAAKLFPRLRVFVALCDEYGDALAALRRASGKDNRIRIALLKDKYPQKDEKLLVRTVTGGKHTDGRTLVLDVQTIAAVGRAVRDGEPSLTRIITVGGDAVANPRAVEAPAGADYHELTAACGGYIQTPARIILGGSMRGTEVFSDGFPVDFGDTAITALLSLPSAAGEECIRCGRCAAVCPYGLMPNFVNYFLEQGLTERLSEVDYMRCTFCGACAYSCPAHINLVQVMRRAVNTDTEHQEG